MSTPPNANFYICPHCSQMVQAIPAAAEQMVACPCCQGTFLVPAADRAAQQADELDGTRIQQLAKARRAAIRARSYLVIGLVACVVTIAQLTWNLAHMARSQELGLRAIGYASAILLLIWLAGCLARQVKACSREVRSSVPPRPAPAPPPPDFSSLSDGSQHARNLDKLRGP